MNKNLIELIGEPAMLEQTAEECSELAQACLKMARKLRNDNPTPKTDKEIRDNLCEEIADVLICIGELENGLIIDVNEEIAPWICKKQKRMEERFNEYVG